MNESDETCHTVYDAIKTLKPNQVRNSLTCHSHIQWPQWQLFNYDQTIVKPITSNNENYMKMPG